MKCMSFISSTTLLMALFGSERTEASIRNSTINILPLVIRLSEPFYAHFPGNALFQTYLLGNISSELTSV